MVIVPLRLIDKARIGRAELALEAIGGATGLELGARRLGQRHG